MSSVSFESVKKKLVEKGYRSAKTRDFLLAAFLKSKKPLSAPLLLVKLRKNKRLVNKTTVYRELEILAKERIIEKVEMGDRQRWYESALRKHHHHAVCEKCGKVVDLDIPEKMKAELELIATKKRFMPLRHTIEFFGLCAKCQKN